MLTVEEAEGIAVPAANIMAKYMDSDLLAKYSDPLALLIALGVVVAPRVVVNVTSVKKKECAKIGPVNTSKQDDRGSAEDSRVGSGEPARNAGANVETTNHELYGIIDNVDF